MTFVPRSFAAIIRNDNGSHWSWVEWTSGSTMVWDDPSITRSITQQTKNSCRWSLKRKTTYQCICLSVGDSEKVDVQNSAHNVRSTCTGWPGKWHHFPCMPWLHQIIAGSQNQEEICNNSMAKDSTTPQVCRYTTLWNVSVLVTVLLLAEVFWSICVWPFLPLSDDRGLLRLFDCRKSINKIGEIKAYKENGSIFWGYPLHISVQ